MRPIAQIAVFGLLLGAGAWSAGDRSDVALPQLTFSDVGGKKVTLADWSGKPVAIFVTSTTCPISKRLAPEVGRISSEYAKQGISFVFVDPIRTDSARDLGSMAKENRWSGTIAKGEELPAALGARTTTEAFLFDKSGKLRYRGAVNDQFSLTSTAVKAKNHYFREALEAVLAGKEFQRETDAPGCALSLSQPSADEKVTYHAQISRIIQKNCLSCHRTGGVAPFSLETQKDVESHGAMIKTAIEKRLMPPWFAAETPKGEASPWKNDRSLPETDKTALLAWIASDHPAGDPSKAPKKATFADTWELGKPDQVFQIPDPIAVKADGYMEYQNVMVPTNLTEDKWVSSMEIIPSDRSVVHHVLVFVIPKNYEELKGAEKVKFQLETMKGFFAAYAPGNSNIVYPAGFGKKLPAGSRLLFEIHYTPNGHATQDQVRLGLHYADAAVTHEVKTAGLFNFTFRIPAGDSNYTNSSKLPVPKEARILSFMPHMHLRGKACRYELHLPDGSTKELLQVPRWDFNWQLRYELKQPLTVPSGSTLEYFASYDNSANNPANPDPKRVVGWGDQTYDEMLLGYVEYYYP